MTGLPCLGSPFCCTVGLKYSRSRGATRLDQARSYRLGAEALTVAPPQLPSAAQLPRVVMIWCFTRSPPPPPPSPDASAASAGAEYSRVWLGEGTTGPHSSGLSGCSAATKGVAKPGGRIQAAGSVPASLFPCSASSCSAGKLEAQLGGSAPVSWLPSSRRRCGGQGRGRGGSRRGQAAGAAGDTMGESPGLRSCCAACRYHAAIIHHGASREAVPHQAVHGPRPSLLALPDARQEQGPARQLCCLPQRRTSSDLTARLGGRLPSSWFPPRSSTVRLVRLSAGGSVPLSPQLGRTLQRYTQWAAARVACNAGRQAAWRCQAGWHGRAQNVSTAGSGSSGSGGGGMRSPAAGRWRQRVTRAR